MKTDNKILIKALGFRLIALSSVVVVFFLIGELFVRLFYPYLANYNLEMWRYAKDLKQPLNNPQLPFHHFPDKAGHYYGVDIKTNSIGFRDNEYLPKKDGNFRILMIGDSMTMGWGVPFDDIMAKQLEKLLKKQDQRFEVINMGIGNYNSAMELELFKIKGLPLKPDMVVLVFFINDAEPTPHVSRLNYVVTKRSYFGAFLYDRWSRAKALSSNRHRWQTYYEKLYDDEAEGLLRCRDSINEIIRICRINAISLLIVNMPELHVVKRDEYPFKFATNFLKRLAKAQGVSFLDLQPAFEPYPARSLWVSAEDSHANAKAQGIAAGVIYEALKEKPLNPEPKEGFKDSRIRGFKGLLLSAFEPRTQNPEP